MSEPRSQVDFLSALIQLEKRFRSAQNTEELSYRMANETLQLVQYDHLIVWAQGVRGIDLKAVSGLDQIPVTAPFCQQLKALVPQLRRRFKTQGIATCRAQDCEKELRQSGDEGENGAATPLWTDLLWVPLVQEGGQVELGCLVLRNGQSWSPQEVNLFDHVAATWGHAWNALYPRRRRFVGARWWWLLVLAVGGVSLWPVPISVLAPAQVISRDETMVSSALDGIVARFHVEPNTVVVPGQLLVSLDKTALTSRLLVARKAHEVVQAQLERAQQRAFNDPEAREAIHQLRSEVAQKEAEVDYARELLAYTDILSPAAGVVIFNDAYDWIGRPVQAGERILHVASADNVQLQIMLPVRDAIALNPDVAIPFYLNVEPTAPRRARLVHSGYHAVDDPVAGPAYPLKADFITADAGLRLGLRGTVRLYGRTVPLLYAVLRQPLTWLRQYTGL
ncbi:efflux RND transporter periplasmic adaptor subunit [Desulfuromonas thiophila]|uniref:efflux RND transporter periplasmic adaptor subunit n=1 Tax=Desulfuromonas thiophila TaxID=57664 RepID=UPI0024A93222|nr:HlyD family efflux transporter periplasmic adaptor subunit [Desulfuromonas thiophila]